MRNILEMSEKDFMKMSWAHAPHMPMNYHLETVRIALEIQKSERACTNQQLNTRRNQK